jgi:hypothetical protein
MTDTHRTTVPVEPTELVRLSSETAEYLIRVAEDADDNQWQDWAATMRQASQQMLGLCAMLSVAPAPEDGADFYKVKAAIERAMMDERDGKPCGCIIEAGCESRGYADPAYAASGFIWAATDAVMQALATREEAPAEAGAVTHSEACHYADTSGDPLISMARTAWQRLEGEQPDVHAASVTLHGLMLALAYEALRAQPPAREDA